MVKMIRADLFVVLYVLFSICLFSGVSSAESDIGIGMPMKYISSCEIDLDNNNASDIALLVETVRDRELIVLMKGDKRYEAFLLTTGKKGMLLSCHFGKYVKETSAGRGKKEGKIFETLGTYVKLKQPEGATVVYFWHKNSFKEVWTAD